MSEPDEAVETVDEPVGLVVLEDPVITRAIDGSVETVTVTLDNGKAGGMPVRLTDDIARAYWPLTKGMRIIVVGHREGPWYVADSIEVVPST